MRFEIARQKDELQRFVREWRGQNLRIGLVPTMGALHAGHLSLIEQITPHCDKIITSIFVNPTQFAAHEDLDDYPRQEQADLQALAKTPTSLVYIPTLAQIYPSGFSSRIEMDGVAQGLEAVSRPHFFGGVAIVVAKLFLQTSADWAIFGEKDYQQLQVIRQMVKDFDMPIEILGAPIIREADGLAMSSRNQYLSPAQRQIAGRLNIILKTLASSRLPISEAEAEAEKALYEAGFDAVDYATIRDAQTLAAPSDPAGKTENLRALICARIGTIRLLDNMPCR